MFYIIFSAIVSYFLGCINPATLISKYIYNKDIRSEGSGNPGASNTVRVFGVKAGLAVFVIDFAKGLLSVLIAKLLVSYFNAPYETVLMAGFTSQIGHIFPVFYKFRGGKGVATAAGAAMGIMPFAASVLLIIFAIIFGLTKIVALASIISAALYPLIAYFSGGENAKAMFVFAASASILIIVKHYQNICRLLDGEEKPAK